MDKKNILKKVAIRSYLKLMGIITLILGVFLFYFIEIKIEKSRESLKKDLEKYNFTLRTNLEDNIIESVKWLSIYNDIGILKDFLRGDKGSDSLIKVIEKYAEGNKNINEISIFDFKGEKIKNYFKTNSKDKNLGITSAMKSGMEKNMEKSLFIDIHQHSNNELDFHFYTPVVNDNKILGYIGLSYGLDNFFYKFRDDFKDIFSTKHLGVLNRKNLEDSNYFSIDLDSEEIKKVIQSKNKVTSPFVIKEGIEESLTEYFGKIEFDSEFKGDGVITFYSPIKESREIIFKSIKQYFLFAGILLFVLAFILWLYIKEKVDKISTFKEAKTYNIRLRKTIETKDMLFSLIGHDLRSPFTSQLGYFKLLQKKFDTYEKEELKKYIDIMSINSEKLSVLTENILRWAAIHNKNIEYSPENLRLSEIVEEYEEIFKIQLASKNLKLTVDIDDTSTVISDKNLLEASLRNLLSNAIKYSKKNGNIRVFAKEKEEFISLSIEDEGMGIPAEIKKSVLKGTQVSTIGTYGEKGIGLGLYVVREFTKLNRGKVYFESEEEKGTKFTLLIPRGSV